MTLTFWDLVAIALAASVGIVIAEFLMTVTGLVGDDDEDE